MELNTVSSRDKDFSGRLVSSLYVYTCPTAESLDFWSASLSMKSEKGMLYFSELSDAKLTDFFLFLNFEMAWHFRESYCEQELSGMVEAIRSAICFLSVVRFPLTFKWLKEEVDFFISIFLIDFHTVFCLVWRPKNHSWDDSCDKQQYYAYLKWWWLPLK